MPTATTMTTTRRPWAAAVRASLAASSNNAKFFRQGGERMNRIVKNLACAAAMAAISTTACAADKKAQPALNAVTPDATICSVSAIDRTVPFTVGDKALYFVNIRDGDKVRSPFRVVFAVSGMGAAPVAAGNIEGTGHHHILID